jgi:hypothetical protein
VNRRLRLRLVLGGGLVVAFLFVTIDPGTVIKPDLQDNLIAEALGAIVTLLIVDFAFEASEEREERRALRELRAALVHTLDADLHGLWSALLPEPLARDAPLRRAPRRDRIETFARELGDPKVWAGAPAAQAEQARARVRDLGEDAERMLVLSENVTEFPFRLKLDELRRACRALDEAWGNTPRDALAECFRSTIAPEVRELLQALVGPAGEPA